MSIKYDINEIQTFFIFPKQLLNPYQTSTINKSDLYKINDTIVLDIEDTCYTTRGKVTKILLTYKHLINFRIAFFMTVLIIF